MQYLSERERKQSTWDRPSLQEPVYVMHHGSRQIGVMLKSSGAGRTNVCQSIQQALAQKSSRPTGGLHL